MRSVLPLFGFLILAISANAQDTIKATDDRDNPNRSNLLSKNKVERWEDGLRTNLHQREFEWWYFDAKVIDKDGEEKTVVVGFYTKNFLTNGRRSRPFITVNIHGENKKPPFSCVIKADRKRSFFATKVPMVQMGDSYFKDSLNYYVVRVSDKKNEIKLKLTLKKDVISWRPKDGYRVLNGNDSTRLELMKSKEHFAQPNDRKSAYFAWVVPVPKGDAIVDISYLDCGKLERVEGKGTGYHDHNWGNRKLSKLFNHWYWGRSNFDDYTVVAANLVAHKKYDFKENTTFHVFKDSSSATNDDDTVMTYRSYGLLDKSEGKDVSKKLFFIHRPIDSAQPSFHYSLAEKNRDSVNMLAAALSGKAAPNKKGVFYHLVKILSGFDGTYYRFSGRADLTIIDNNNMKKPRVSKNSIWELMYLGKPLK